MCAAPEETMNYFKTAILLAGMTALFMGVGYLIGGQAGMLIALVVAAGMNLFAYWNSDKMVLRMHGAQEVDAATAPELLRIVARARRARRAADAARLSHGQPAAQRLRHRPQPGERRGRRHHRAPADCSSRDEIAGVMAHELAHVKNRDTLTMTITATLAGAISMLANFGLFFGGNREQQPARARSASIALVILAPLAAMVVQMAISRAREYEADRGGAEISGQPLSLASALQQDFAARPSRSRTKPPRPIRRPRTSSSSIRCRASAWTICSRPIRRPRTASPRSRRSLTKWAIAGACSASPPRRRDPWQRARARGPWG